MNYKNKYNEIDTSNEYNDCQFNRSVEITKYKQYRVEQKREAWSFCCCCCLYVNNWHIYQWKCAIHEVWTDESSNLYAHTHTRTRLIVVHYLLLLYLLWFDSTTTTFIYLFILSSFRMKNTDAYIICIDKIMICLTFFTAEVCFIFSLFLYHFVNLLTGWKT